MNRNKFVLMKFSLIFVVAVTIICSTSLFAQERVEISVQSGHTNWVESVAFSPDGKYALSGSSDNTLKLWDVTTGRELKTFEGHTSSVRSVAYSPDGRYALSGSWDTTVRIWDIETTKTIKVFRKHKGFVQSVAFSPDGKFALSGGDDGTMMLWDVTTGEELRVFKHPPAVLAVAFSPDGKYALSGSLDGSIKLWNLTTGDSEKFWDVSTGKEIDTFKVHADAVTSVTFSPDGKYVVSGSNDKTVKIWNKRYNPFLSPPSTEEIGVAVKSVAFSRDGKHVAVAGLAQDINVYDCEKMTVRDYPQDRDIMYLMPRFWSGILRKAHKLYVNSVAFSPDGKYLLSGGADNSLKLWDVPTTREVRAFKGWLAPIGALSSSSDGSHILSKATTRFGDNVLWYWNLLTPKETKAFAGQPLCYSINGRYAILGSYKETLNSFHLKLLDLFEGKEINTFDIPAVNAIAISPNGRYVVSGEKNFTLLNTSTGQEEKAFSGHHEFLERVEFSPDGKYIISEGIENSLYQTKTGESSATLKIWDIYTGKEILQLVIGASGSIPIAFSPEGKYALAADKDEGILRLWELSTGREIRTFKGHWHFITSVAFSPDGKYALSGSADNLVKLWDVATGKEIATFSRHTKTVYSVAFSADGKYALSGGSDEIMVLWDIATGKLLKTFKGHSQAVMHGAFLKDGKYVVSGSNDGTIKLWDISTGEEVATLVGFTDGEWVIIIPEGYYDSSHYGYTRLTVRKGSNVYETDQFHSIFYRPDIIAAKLRGEDISNKIATNDAVKEK